MEVKRPARAVVPLILILALGCFAFWTGVARDPEQTWKIFLVNFLFWSGISISGVVFAAVLELTQAGWAVGVRRVAESFSGFLPLSLLLYLLLLQGAGSIYPWIADPPPGRAGWFTFSSFLLRDTLAILLLYGTGVAFVRASARRRRATGGAAGSLSALAAVLILVYAVVFSLIAVDMVMSLEPYWISTLFPAFFFMGNLYAGIAAVAVASFLWRSWTGLECCLDAAQAHDLGKILFGFCLLWTYLFWSQYLVIWYGNLPEEVQFLILRTQGAWQTLAWTVLALCFVFPFVTLLGRPAKQPAPLCVIALVAVAGVWLERFLLVVPSEKLALNFSWLDLFVTLGFLSLFVLTQVVFFPIAARAQTYSSSWLGDCPRA